MMSKNTLLTSLSCIFVLNACAELKSIHRVSNVSGIAQIEYIDAKQRAVLINGIKDNISTTDKGNNNIKDKTTTMQYRMCSEAAPDVFSAFATSLSAKASQNATSLGGSLGLSSAETAATIERTQTINLMRESMYRTCERFLNGAYTTNQMQIQAARDQRAMVAVLAIEQLTGTNNRSATILSPAAQVTMSETSNDLWKEYKESKKLVSDKKVIFEEKEKTHSAAKKHYEGLDENKAIAENGGCSVLESTPESNIAPPQNEGNTAPSANTPTSSGTNATTVVTAGTIVTTTNTPVLAGAANTEASSSEPVKTKQELKTQCLSAKETMTTTETAKNKAKTELDEANEALKQVNELAKLYSPSHMWASTSATNSTHSASGNKSDNCPTCMAKTVENITRMAFDNKTEIIYICLGVLDTKDAHVDTVTKEACRELFTAELGARTAEAKLSEATSIAATAEEKLEESIFTSNTYTDNKFEVFWKKAQQLNRSQGFPKQGVKQLVAPLMTKYPRNKNSFIALLNAKNRTELETAFAGLFDLFKKEISQ